MLAQRSLLLPAFCICFVTAELQWSSLGSAPWRARYDHGVAVDSTGRIVIAGGANAALGDYLNDSWAFENGRWTELPAASWSERCDVGLAALLNGTIVLVGGQREDGPYPTHNDVHVLHKGAANWEAKGAAPWAARIGHQLTACPDGGLVLTAGANSRTAIFGLKIFSDVWRMSPDGAWTQITDKAPWEARFDHRTVCLSDNSLILIGGHHGLKDFNDVWRMSKDGAWTKVQDKAPWRARSDFMMAAGSDDVIVVAGEFEDTWSLEGILKGPANLKWTKQQNMDFQTQSRWRTNMVALANKRYVVPGGKTSEADESTNDVLVLSESRTGGTNVLV